MWRDIIAIGLCVLLGLRLFGFLYTAPSVPIGEHLDYTGFMLRYSGTIDSIDTASKRIKIVVPETYAAESQTSQVVEFQYDEDTVWGSNEFVMRADTVIQMRTEITDPIALPAGAWVTISRDPTRAGDLRAHAISYVRRISP